MRRRTTNISTQTSMFTALASSPRVRLRSSMRVRTFEGHRVCHLPLRRQPLRGVALEVIALQFAFMQSSRDLSACGLVMPLVFSLHIAILLMYVAGTLHSPKRHKRRPLHCALYIRDAARLMPRRGGTGLSDHSSSVISHSGASLLASSPHKLLRKACGDRRDTRPWLPGRARACVGMHRLRSDAAGALQRQGRLPTPRCARRAFAGEIVSRAHLLIWAS